LANGYQNFRLEILEYCAKSKTIQKEQFYIDLLKPVYNILTKACSSLGYKHSEETLVKYKSRVFSEKALANLRKTKIGVVLSPLSKANQLLASSHVITIENVESKDIIEYSSIRDVARKLGVNHATLLNYVDKNKLFKAKYIIKRLQKKKLTPKIEESVPIVKKAGTCNLWLRT
jgi:group I intron endonuclease